MVFEKIVEMLVEKLDCDASEIKPDTKFSDLGIDSLDVAELVMDVEETFEIEMQMDPSLSTVGALVAKIEELKG